MSIQSEVHANGASQVATPALGDVVDPANIDPQWQSLQMLPARFVMRRQGKRILYGWFCVLFGLLALFCVLTAAFYLGAKKTTSENARIVAKAAPLMQMRQETTRMKQQNLQQANWSRLVKSAHPDDSLLQALGAISVATEADENEIDVKTINVKLALESPHTTKLAPVWAKSHLQITADVVGQETARTWVERMNASARTSTMELRQTNVGKWIDGTIQVTGEPVATRVLP